MKTLTRIVLFLAIIALGVPVLHARNNRPRVIKSITTDNDPAVIAERERLKAARKALLEAEANRDKSAIEAAQKEKHDVQKELSAARKKAFAEGKKQQQRQQRR